MKFVTVTILAIALLSLFGCSNFQQNRLGVSKETVAAPQGVAGDTMQETISKLKADETKIPDAQATDRKIIRNGEFTIETKTPADDQRKIAGIAEALGGFVVTSEFQQTSNVSSGTTVNVIVRIPSAQFQKATDEIRKTGIQVIREKLSGQDVTEEYVDLEARLRTKKALEAQFLEIMKRASKISDALEVQEKITEVRTEIERLEGRRRLIDNQAALSTINITLQTTAPLVAVTQTGFWASIKNSFGDGVDVAVAIILGAIHLVTVLLPVALLIFLPLGLVLRYLNRRFGWFGKAKKQPVTESQL